MDDNQRQNLLEAFGLIYFLFTNVQMEQKAKSLERKIARKRKTLKKLNAIIRGDRSLAEHFHLGRVGFMSGGAARRKAASLDWTIEAASKAVKLEEEIRWLEHRINHPRITKPKKERKTPKTLSSIRVAPADELRLYEAGFTKEQYFAHMLAGGIPVAGLERINQRISEVRDFQNNGLE